MASEKNQISSYLDNLQIQLTPELESGLSLFKIKTYNKGEYFIQEGQIAKNIAFVLEGMVRHYYNIDGKEYTRWVSLKNNFVTALSSFIRQSPSTENLECIEDCKMLYLDYKQFMELKSKSKALQTLWQLSLENEIIGYEERVCHLITNDGEKRYLDFLEKYPAHAMQVPQKYIASMLGIAPRHLSRIRNNLTPRQK